MPEWEFEQQKKINGNPGPERTQGHPHREQTRSSFDSWISQQIPVSLTGQPLHDVGPASRAIYSIIGNEQQTQSLVANAFWQGYINSETFKDDFPYAAERKGLPIDRDNPPDRMLVVPIGPGEFILVIESTVLASGVLVHPAVTKSDLVLGWERFHSGRQRYSFEPETSLLTDLLKHACVEAAHAGDFWLISTPRQEEERTNIPTPGREVQAGTTSSTAGACAQDSMQRKGVTAAYHAVDPRNPITVDGLSAIFVNGDSVTDSCFLEITDPDIVTRSTHGPLKLAPRAHEAATFEGFVNKSGTARVLAWSYELPYIDPNLQPTVRTDQVTSQGDSGCALIDTAGYIIGFAHSRSGHGSPVTYSSWIWADAVFRSLGLTTY